MKLKTIPKAPIQLERDNLKQEVSRLNNIIANSNALIMTKDSEIKKSNQKVIELTMRVNDKDKQIQHLLAKIEHEACYTKPLLKEIEEKNTTITTLQKKLNLKTEYNSEHPVIPTDSSEVSVELSGDDHPGG